MNIIFVSDQYWPSLSGVSVSIDSFGRELTKMGHHVFLMAPEYPGSENSESQWIGAGIVRFRSNGLMFKDDNRLVSWRERKKFNNVLDSVKPDIIHLQTEFALGLFAIRYARKHKVPLVITTHINWEVLMTHYTPFTHKGLARMYCRHLMRKRYNKADLVIVPSLWMETLLNLYYVTAPIRVLPTGIVKSDFEFCRESNWKESVYKAFPQLVDKRILFYAGRLGMEKNISFLMDVLKILLPGHGDIILMIAGKGPAYQELQEYSKYLGIEERVLFTGFIERKQLKKFYAISDVFVFASKVESQGLATIESMICGTPVVAIGKMGINEVMAGDKGGYIVEDNPDSFAEKTALLLDNPELHKLKTEEAVQYSAKWTSDKSAEKLNRLYESLITKNI